MDIYPSQSVIPSGCPQGDTSECTPSQEPVKPSSGTPIVQQGNNSAVGQKGSEQSVYQRNVSVNAQSPSERKEITINDAEFHPPVKMNKLALAIKIFCKSFKEMRHVNNPETDRSPRVESIRSKTLTAIFSVLHPLSCLISVPTATALGSGLMLGIMFLATLDAAAIMLMFPGFMVAIALAVGVFYAGCKLASAAESFLTSVVSASADTREKLAEMTASTSPEAKFLNKFRRMEESLRALQIKRYAAQSAKIDAMPDSPQKTALREQLESRALEEELPSLDNEKWYDTYQRYCLRDGYEGDIKDLNNAIKETKDWLNRASRQKILLDKAQQQDLDVKTASRKPDAEQKELGSEIPSQWVQV